MAYRWVHVTSGYDPGRRRVFYLYRFPYSRETIEELKAHIQEPGARFWYPRTKAWHIAEGYEDLAEDIILESSGLSMCSVCLRGPHCKAWSHLASTFWDLRERPDPSRPEPPKDQERWYDPGKGRDTAWALKVLGLSSIPSGSGLKKIFRELVLEYHPDRKNGDNMKMSLINSARDYLDGFISG